LAQCEKTLRRATFSCGNGVIKGGQEMGLLRGENNAGTRKVEAHRVGFIVQVRGGGN